MMLRKIFGAVLILALLNLSVMADSIRWQELSRAVSRQEVWANSTPSMTSANSQGQIAQTQSADDGAAPKFVRLPDGRIVPFGAGVICTEDCVQDTEFEMAKTKRPILWYALVPIAIGGIIAVLASRGGDPVGPNGNPRLFDLPGGTPNPTGTPRPLPSPNPNAQVPEPATMILFGSGLALIAQRIRKKKAEA